MFAQKRRIAFFLTLDANRKKLFVKHFCIQVLTKRVLILFMLTLGHRFS